MKKRLLSMKADGFYGIWYPNSKRESHCGMILMLGDSSDGRMVCGKRISVDTIIRWNSWKRRLNSFELKAVRKSEFAEYLQRG